MQPLVNPFGKVTDVIPVQPLNEHTPILVKVSGKVTPRIISFHHLKHCYVRNLDRSNQQLHDKVSTLFPTLDRNFRRVHISYDNRIM